MHSVQLPDRWTLNWWILWKLNHAVPCSSMKYPIFYKFILRIDVLPHGDEKGHKKHKLHLVGRSYSICYAEFLLFSNNIIHRELEFINYYFDSRCISNWSPGIKSMIRMFSNTASRYYWIIQVFICGIKQILLVILLILDKLISCDR